MYYRQQLSSVMGAHGYSTEVAGRDRVRFFRRPVEPGSLPNTYTDINTIRFASSAPSTPLPLDQFLAASAARTASAGRGRGVARPARLPAMPSASPKPPNAARRPKGAVTPPHAREAGPRDAGAQTVYRENDAQTDPYTPAYVIPPGGDPNPEVLGLRELHWNDGLPAGMEEVELIERLRRRRALEASLPPPTNAHAAEARHCALFALEEKERADREAHLERLRERRLAAVRNALAEREGAREEANRERLERIQAQKLRDLRRVLERAEARRLALARGVAAAKSATSTEKGDGGDGTRRETGRGIICNGGEDCKLQEELRAQTQSGRRDLISAYSRYGTDATPPQLVANGNGNGNGNAPTTGALVAVHGRVDDHGRHYDVRPTLLALPEGIAELETARVPRMQRVSPNAFAPPTNYAIDSLPTLYQRREATRVMEALDYVHAKLHPSDAPAERVRVLELYRATPRLQRPDTPELELEGDADEERDEACILLQRLLRGRAVQNDFFDGKERCRGLIEELQAASNAKYAERSATAAHAEEEAKRREAFATGVIDDAQGAVIADTLDYLFHELTRQRDLSALEQLRRSAEEMREEREAHEIQLRVEERILREKQAVQYAACVRVMDDVIECYAHDLYESSAARAAMVGAIEAENARRDELPAMSPLLNDSEATETAVCDMLDNFVLPAVVDMVRGVEEEIERRAPAGVAAEVPRD